MGGKRQQWSRGAVVAVPLGDGIHSYAQMLDFPEYAFFDCRTNDELPTADIIAQPVLFRLWVTVSAHSTGRWKKVGPAEVSVTLQKPVLRYNQDPLQPEDIRLTFDGANETLGTVEDCEGLECAAVWEAEHVEDRLRSHFAGIPCEWTLSMRPVVAAPTKAKAPKAKKKH